MTNATLKNFRAAYEQADTPAKLLDLTQAIMAEGQATGFRPAAHDLLDSCSWKHETLMHSAAINQGCKLTEVKAW